MSRYVPHKITMEHDFPWSVRDMERTDDIVVYGFFKTRAAAQEAAHELNAREDA